jgi:hypothetical protein
MRYNPDTNTAKIRKWLGKSAKNVKALSAFIEAEGHGLHGIAHALSGHDFDALRKKIVKEFKIK